MFLRGCWKLFVCMSTLEWLKGARWSHRKHWEYSKSGEMMLSVNMNQDVEKYRVCSNGTEYKTSNCSIASIMVGTYTYYFAFCTAFEYHL